MLLNSTELSLLLRRNLSLSPSTTLTPEHAFYLYFSLLIDDKTEQTGQRKPH